MATIGQHETAQRLHLSGVGAVYALKSDEKKVIKALQPPAGIWSEEILHQEIGGFIARAQTQQDLAKKSSNWAPVYELGVLRDDPAAQPSDAPQESPATPAADIPPGTTGAFAIMDRYERSIQSLIDGRVNITNDDLRNLMSGIIRGLFDISSQSARPHGNLKPSNILLAHSHDLAAAAVFLADPAPDAPQAKKNAAKDHTDLGKIIFHLVNLRPYDGALIAKSKDWSRLGPNGEDWRKLCNNLLDAQAPAEDRDFEKSSPPSQNGPLAPPRSKAPLLIGVSAVLLLGGGGTAFFLLTREKKLDFSQPKWETLCLSEAQWFEKFSAEMADPAVQKKFAADPRYPTGVAKAFDAASKDLDKFSPEAISGESGRSPLHLAAKPTQAAMLYPGPNTTDKADRLIDSVKIALGPDQWPLLGQLDKTAREYQNRGWTGPAKEIQDLIAAAKPPALPDVKTPIADRVSALDDAKPVDMGMVIDGTIAAKKNVDTAESARKLVTDDLAALPQGDAQNIPLVKALPQFAQDFPASAPDLKSLAATLTNLDKTLKDLKAALTPSGKQIDFADLAADSSVQLPAGKLSPTSFDPLPDTIKKYVILSDDPRKSVDWNGKIAAVEKNEIEFIRTSNASDANLPKLQQADAQLKQMVADWANIPAIESHRADLAQRVSGAQTALGSLETNASTWSAPYRIDPKVYLAQQRDRLTGTPLAKATPVVYTAWKTHQNALITELAAAGDEIKQHYTKFQEFDNKFNTTEKTFQDIDALIPASVPGLSAVGGSDWKHAIAAHVATADREATLGQIIAALKWTDDLPQAADPGFVSSRDNLLKDFDRTRTDALSLLIDFTGITARLDHLELTPADTPAGTASWPELFAKWMPAKNPLISDPAVAAALQPINDRVAALQATEKLTDYKQLLTATQSPAPEIALTAWRNLGNAAITEDTSGGAALDDEIVARTRLLAMLQQQQNQKVLEVAAGDKIRAEIAAQEPLRWRRLAATLTSAKNIEHALDLLGNGDGNFNVQLSANTDRNLYYDQLLYTLKQKFQKNSDVAYLSQPDIAPAFEKSVRDVPPVASLPAVGVLLKNMDNSLSKNQQESGSTKAGPALASWTPDPARSKGDLRVFTHTGTDGKPYALEFRKVKADGEEKGAYLATAELTFGLFAQTINASPKARSDLNNATTADQDKHWFEPSGDTWDLGGPRVWRIDQGSGRFSAATQWLPNYPEFPNAATLYPAAAAIPPPSDSMPMQYLSPWSAMYTAQLLGCRLPTTAEWKAALDADLKSHPDSKDSWNLRGNAFQAQLNYAKATVAKPQQDQMPYPDQGIFLPKSMSNNQNIQGANASVWTADQLSKLPAIGPRFNPGTSTYAPGGNPPLWFREAGKEPGKEASGTGAGDIHDLIGNVGQYVFDTIPDIQNNTPSTAAIDALIAKAGADKDGKKIPNLFVIGGSALSPPQMPPDQPQAVDLRAGFSDEGFSDVGVRLAYTVPIATIAEVLEEEFKNPHYLPGTTAAAR